MKLAISNIAWNPEEDDQALALLEDMKIGLIELAPRKVWGEIANITKEDVERYTKKLRAYGISVAAFQSLLFGQDQLSLFGSTQTELRDYLLKIFEIASFAGANALIFGSPKNRIRGDIAKELAMQRAAKYFLDLLVEAKKYPATLCIEPNPEEYGADFVTNLSEAMELVNKVRSEKLRLQIDTGEIFLKSESNDQILKALPLAGHVHISEPFLEEVGSPGSDHDRIARLLKDSKYGGVVSIEMRASEGNLERIRRVVDFVRQVYGL